MSLDFDLSKIEDFKDLCYLEDDTMNPITQVIIFATMAVGIGEITGENWRKFYARLHVYEIVFGSYLVGPDGNVYISPEDVANHIGLHCNVSFETDTQFKNRIFNALYTEALNDAKKVELNV